MTFSDKEKYREMIIDTAETVLGHFGFDRTVYRDEKNPCACKWDGIMA
jgi:hypothetical protein